MTFTKLDEQSVVAASPEQVFADLFGETAILNVRSGVYYGLDGVGVRIWALLQEPRRVGEIRDALVAEYEVSPIDCERDLLHLLTELVGAKLVEIRDGNAS